MVDWKQVENLESDQELLVKQDAYSGEKAKSLQASDDGKVVLANGRHLRQWTWQYPTDHEAQAH